RPDDPGTGTHQGLTGVTPVFYVSRRIRSFLRRQTSTRLLQAP
ncbi:hypothetical protein CSB96_6745, partial [Pseudomonas aeruginosa]